LTALKPHLVFLFGLAVLLWALERRRWGVLLACGLTLLAATAIPLACNPSVVEQYRATLGSHSPSEWATPTLGTALRLVFGVQHTWLQFAPTVAGLIWFLPYWCRYRRSWDWAEQTPLLLLVSFLTSFYGTWSHDYVVLLLPAVQIATWLVHCRRRTVLGLALLAYLAVSGVVLALPHELALIWLSSAVLLIYLGLRKLLCRTPARSTSEGKPLVGASGFCHNRAGVSA
jgi:hypothetical protein